MNETIEDKPKEEETESPDYSLDFTTSSAISRMNLKFLLLYIPVLWFSGIFCICFWYFWTISIDYWSLTDSQWIAPLILIPFGLFGMLYVFIIGCVFFSKLFLILINLIHKPKEGIFLAEAGNRDFEFWRLRTELKKIVLWLMRHSPLPWVDVWAFKWFGNKIDFSSHLLDAWCDCEFVKFGRKVLIGQGTVIMSSMVVGKYLIIKEVMIDDYVVTGGHSTVSPGTFIGKDSVLGAASITTFKQIIEPALIFFGVPAIKLKENKYAETNRDYIRKVDLDGDKQYYVKHEVNIDEDKKHKLE